MSEHKDKKPKVRCEYWIGAQKYVRIFGSEKQARGFISKQIGVREPIYIPQPVRSKESSE